MDATAATALALAFGIVGIGYAIYSYVQSTAQANEHQKTTQELNEMIVRLRSQLKDQGRLRRIAEIKQELAELSTGQRDINQEFNAANRHFDNVASDPTTWSSELSERLADLQATERDFRAGRIRHSEFVSKIIADRQKFSAVLSKNTAALGRHGKIMQELAIATQRLVEETEKISIEEKLHQEELEALQNLGD